MSLNAVPLPRQDIADSDRAAGFEASDTPIFQSLARSWSADGRLVPGMNDQEWNAAQLNLMLHGAFGHTLDAIPVETMERQTAPAGFSPISDMGYMS